MHRTTHTTPIGQTQTKQKRHQNTQNKHYQIQTTVQTHNVYIQYVVHKYIK